MEVLLEGFTDELVKLSSKRVEKEDARLRQLYRKVKKRTQKGSQGGKLRGQGRKVSRDYLASMLVGATGYPLGVLAGSKFSRVLHNRDVRRAIARTKRRSTKQLLKKEIRSGPTVGREHPGMPRSKKPLITGTELAGQGARGVVMGSIVQMLRDRFSGSAGAGDAR